MFNGIAKLLNPQKPAHAPIERIPQKYFLPCMFIYAVPYDS